MNYLRKRKMVHLVTDRFTLGGGIEHIFQITRNLKEFDFRVFGLPGPAVEKFKGLENVEIHDKGYTPGYVLKSKPDAVHIHHLKPLVSFFKNPSSAYRFPVYYTAHGIHLHKYEFMQRIDARIKHFLRFNLERYLLKFPDTVIAVSREDRYFIKEEYGVKNVEYIPNGIDISTLGKRVIIPKENFRAELGFSPDTFLFVTVARFDFQKGYDILIKAIARLKDKLDDNNIDCLFVFVGDGNQLESMKRLSASYSLDRYIRFMGAQPNGPDYIKAADVFVLPSRWEGLPIVLLECGLLGVPVIVSRTYGNRDIIDSDKGIFFKNLDEESLAQILNDVIFDNEKYDLQDRIKNLHREVITSYALEEMIDKIRKLYYKE